MSPQFARMGGFGGGSSNSFDPMPTGASPTTTNGANYPAINVRASLNTNGYGRWCVYICKSVSLSCWCILSLLCPRWFQMALSPGHSSLLEQQRPCGPSGRASTSHRAMQSRIPMPKATSKTYFLWVRRALSLYTTLTPSALSLRIILFCLFNLIQDVLSMLDQPTNFNSDDFEIPMYPQFNEWPGQFFVSLLSWLFCPQLFLYLALLLFFLSCPGEKHSSLALHGLNCTATGKVSSVLFILCKFTTNDISWHLTHRAGLGHTRSFTHPTFPHE